MRLGPCDTFSSVSRDGIRASLGTETHVVPDPAINRRATVATSLRDISHSFELAPLILRPEAQDVLPRLGQTMQPLQSEVST